MAGALERGRGDRWAVFLVSLLVVAGALKTSPLLAGLPVDLTATAAVLILLTAAHELVGVARVPWLAVAVMAAVVVVGALHAPLTDYGTSKTQSLFLLTFLAGFLGAAVLLRTPRRRHLFVVFTVAVGVLFLLLIRFAPDLTVGETGRLSATGATTIATGRFLGAASIATLLLVTTGRIKFFVGLILVSLFTYGAFASGSRGPLLAAAIAAVVILPSQFSRRPARTFLVILGGVFALRYAWRFTPAAPRERIEVALSANKGASVDQREFMWKQTWRLVQERPFGVGWGNLGPHIYFDRYPHNLPLEVAGEAGWIGMALLAGLLVFAVRRVVRARVVDSSALPMLGLLVFWFANAMVSGDVNDNRGMFVCLAGCLAIRVTQRTTPPKVPAPVRSSSRPRPQSPHDRAVVDYPDRENAGVLPEETDGLEVVDDRV